MTDVRRSARLASKLRIPPTVQWAQRNLFRKLGICDDNTT
jgi:hypothetical protein